MLLSPFLEAFSSGWMIRDVELGPCCLKNAALFAENETSDDRTVASGSGTIFDPMADRWENERVSTSVTEMSAMTS